MGRKKKVYRPRDGKGRFISKRNARRRRHIPRGGGDWSRRNPWYFGRGMGGGPKGSNLYLPDRTQRGPALVPAVSGWDDPTAIYSALVPGPYRKKRKAKKNGKHTSRRNRHGGVHRARNGAFYIYLPNGQTRFISKRQAARRNGRRHSQYSQMIGQFSTAQRRTKGTQPYARRNREPQQLQMPLLPPDRRDADILERLFGRFTAPAATKKKSAKKRRRKKLRCPPRDPRTGKFIKRR